MHPTREQVIACRKFWRPRRPELAQPCPGCPFVDGNDEELGKVVAVLRAALGLAGKVTKAILRHARREARADIARSGDFTCHHTAYDVATGCKRRGGGVGERRGTRAAPGPTPTRDSAPARRACSAAVLKVYDPSVIRRIEWRPVPLLTWSSGRQFEIAQDPKVADEWHVFEFGEDGHGSIEDGHGSIIEVDPHRYANLASGERIARYLAAVQPSVLLRLLDRLDELEKFRAEVEDMTKRPRYVEEVALDRPLAIGGLVRACQVTKGCLKPPGHPPGCRTVRDL